MKARGLPNPAQGLFVADRKVNGIVLLDMQLALPIGRVYDES